MWHKAEYNGHPMRLEHTRVGFLVKVANHYTKGAQYENRKYKSLFTNVYEIKATDVWNLF